MSPGIRIIAKFNKEKYKPTPCAGFSYVFLYIFYKIFLFILKYCDMGHRANGYN